MDSSTSVYKKRTDYMELLGALKTERSSWDGIVKAVSENIMVRGARFQRTERNRGTRKGDYNKIIDTTGTRALGVLGAGLMAGMSSPARPWHKLALDDLDLMEYSPVKTWLDQVTRIQRNIFARSNTYRALAQVYEAVGAFGTAPMFITSDFQDVINCHPQPFGEYYISTDDKGRVVLIMREFEMTVGQMYAQFGKANCSQTVHNLYRDGKGVNSWVPVIHVVHPRAWEDMQAGTGAKAMPFASCYFEAGTNNDQMLAERGYRRFPVVCARWKVSGGDIYGTSPGMEALGHIERLQHHQLRKSQAIDYAVKPPLQVPASMKDNVIRTLPGGINYVDMAGPGASIKSAWDVRLEMAPLLNDISDLRNRINETFYADLFLMISQDERSNITASEIAARHEEKLLMLGPVLERLHNEFLKGLIEATYEEMADADMLPPPPPELQGMQINVEFVSMLAQAQRAVGTTSVDRFIQYVGNIAQMQAATGAQPTALMKVDLLESIDQYGDMLGIDARVIVPDDVVNERLAAQEEQAAQAQKMAQMESMAAAAKDAGAASASAGVDPMAAMQAVSGYSVPGVL